MVSGRWSVAIDVSGQWSVVSGQSQLTTDNGQQTTVNDGQRTTDNRQPTTDNGQQTMDNGQRTTPTPWTIAEILAATGGELLFELAADFRFQLSTFKFSGISINSRKIFSDEVFVAIRGDVHDGHNFTEDVLEQGIRGLIISRDRIGDLPMGKWQDKGIVCVAVDNTTRSLGHLAAFNRKRSNVSVAAITGSNGKTTTKEMVAETVSRRFCTLSSRGSFNNEIGLPLTLLGLGDSHEWAVVELGMNNPGEIGKLSEICLPDVGVITNIGPAHIGRLGSMEAIMNAKGELLEKIRPGGTAVLNADDPRVAALGDQCAGFGVRTLFYSASQDLKTESPVRALSVKADGIGTFFTLALPAESVPIHLRIPGRFMVSNALAAASVGYVLGLSAQEIKAGIEAFRPVRGRMDIFKTGSGVHIIDDTYNANPESMTAAIMTLRSLKGRHRGILVAGDMLELGEYAGTMHKKIGSVAAGSDVALLYAAGEFAETVAEGARNEGMDSRHIFTGSKSEIIEDLTTAIRPGDWVLVKGSRGMHMEEIVRGVREFFKV
ncbi:UDP-N-acetylmuramoyl-tripeptide--D-alanyl-D-alanine ligase [Desulfobacterales bacterium HSG2]|nr:UDP-N-acetylmuramoyl-tripeptide--D-alanyl-D-alanine ligase [Desulfobacterales bacterium HSG2]